MHGLGYEIDAVGLQSTQCEEQITLKREAIPVPAPRMKINMITPNMINHKPVRFFKLIFRGSIALFRGCSQEWFYGGDLIYQKNTRSGQRSL